MFVGIGLTIGADVPVHFQIGDHALGNEFSFDKVAGQFDGVVLAHLAGNGEFDFTGELGVFPLFGGFNRVPKTLAVPKLIGNVPWRYHLRVDDTALVSEVAMAI